jgi:predicted DNA-binding protein
MKHRKKVAVKSPVNIRISESAKKTLVKLEKRFNRNRADVIEYLIEKTWQELNQKN